MSINTPQHYVKQYADTIQLLLQQKDSRLAGSVSSGSYIGEQASPVDQIGAISMQAVSGRFNPMGRVDATLDRRWVSPQDFQLPQLLDKFDKLRLLIDPESAYVQNAVQAANRQKDDLIIEAFFADAKTGKTGTGTTSFPAGQVIAVNEGSSGNSGLTVAKLRAAVKILMESEVDLSEPIFCPITAKQHDDLLAEAQINSKDFNNEAVLVEGKVKRFMGVNFIHTERLAVDGSSHRRVPLYVPSGMHYGTWNEITTDISQRKDLEGLPWQAYLYMTGGATRVEEKKVIEIKCAE